MRVRSEVHVFHAGVLFADTLAELDVARHFQTQPNATTLQNPTMHGVGKGKKYTTYAERQSREPQTIRNSEFCGFNCVKPGGDEQVYVLAYPNEFLAWAQTVMPPKHLGALAKKKRSVNTTLCSKCKKSKAKGGPLSRRNGLCYRCTPQEIKDKIKHMY